MTPEILAIGEPLVEFNAAKEGPLGTNTTFLQGYGGDTSNFAVAAARAGARVGYITAVGNDPFGRSLMTLWKHEGIDTSRVEISDRYRTGIYFISRTGGTHEFTYFREGSAASRMTEKILPESAIAGAQVLHFSGISQAISPGGRAACARAVELARHARTKISYDPNLRTSLWPLERAREVIHSTIPHVDFLMPSLEDARELTGLGSPEEIVAFYQNMGAGTIVLKCGDQGAVLADREGIRRFPPLSVAQVDAAGAGDAFSGAFMAAYLRGSALADAVRFAGAAAALSVRKIGCVAAIPARQEILDALAGIRSPGMSDMPE